MLKPPGTIGSPYLQQQHGKQYIITENSHAVAQHLLTAQQRIGVKQAVLTAFSRISMHGPRVTMRQVFDQQVESAAVRMISWAAVQQQLPARCVQGPSCAIWHHAKPMIGLRQAATAH
jgi:hypothetical protein